MSNFTPTRPSEIVYAMQPPPPPPAPQGPYGQPPYGQAPFGQPSYGQPQYGQAPFGQPQYLQPQYGQPGSGGNGSGKQPNRTGLIAALVVGVLAIGGIAYAVSGDDSPAAARQSAEERDETDRTDPDATNGNGLPTPVVSTPGVTVAPGATAPSDEVLAAAYIRLTATPPSGSVMSCLRADATIAPAELTAIANGQSMDFQTAAAGVVAIVDCAPDADAAYGIAESLAYLYKVPWDTGCLQSIWAQLDASTQVTLAAESLVDPATYGADATNIFGSCQL